MTDKKETMALRARAGWYRLLAGVFAEELRGPFLRALRTESALAELAAMGVSLGDDFAHEDEAELEEALACEYSMLFVAPGSFPPVESVRLQGGFRQSASSETRAFYAAEGFAAEPGRFATFDDHLAVELGFLAELLERQAQALERGDTAAANRVDKTVKRFWVQHLGRWVRGFARLAERAAQHPFYREMAGLLGAFAEAELTLLKLDVADADHGNWRAPRPPEVDQPMWCGAGARPGEGVEVGVPV